MPDQTLTGPLLRDLVQAKVGGPGKMSFRTFIERAVDERGEGFSMSVVQALVEGNPIKPTPQRMQQIATGLDEPLERIRRAAAREYLGMELPYDEELDYMPALHDMDFDPIPDEHGSDIGVTTSRDVGNTTPAPRSREAILKRVRRIEAAQRAAAEQRDIP